MGDRLDAKNVWDSHLTSTYKYQLFHDSLHTIVKVGWVPANKCVGPFQAPATLGCLPFHTNKWMIFGVPAPFQSPINARVEVLMYWRIELTDSRRMLSSVFYIRTWWTWIIETHDENLWESCVWCILYIRYMTWYVVILDATDTIVIEKVQEFCVWTRFQRTSLLGLSCTMCVAFMRGRSHQSPSLASFRDLLGSTAIESSNVTLW